MQSLFHRMVRAYLDYIYGDTVRLRFRAQMDSLHGLKATRFLDCGCHAGYNTLNAAERLKPDMTMGIEYGASFISPARQRGIEVIQGDLNRPIPLPADSVDVVTAYDVLEHLVETWTFITELHRILVPGGYLVLDSPNLASWHNVFALVLGIQPFSGPNLISLAESDLSLVQRMHRKDHGLSNEGEVVIKGADCRLHRHLVVAAYRSLIKVLEQAGFIVEATWGFGYYPLPPPLARIISKLDPSHAHHYIIRARKPVSDQRHLGSNK